MSHEKQADLQGHGLQGKDNVSQESLPVSAVDFDVQAGLALLYHYT